MNYLIAATVAIVVAMVVVAMAYSDNRISRTLKANLFLVLSISLILSVGVMVWELRVPWIPRWLSALAGFLAGFLVTWFVLHIIKKAFFSNIPRQIN